MLEFNPATEYPYAFAHNRLECEYCLKSLIGQSFVRADRVTSGKYYNVEITPAGWRQVGILEAARPEPGRAFVAMWFDDTTEELYYGGIRPALMRCDFRPPFRIDEEKHNEDINFRIVAAIKRSSLLVADFTGQRQGVYFEAGFAMGLGIPVIRCCPREDVQNLHFDTRNYHHIVWDTPDQLQRDLVEQIEATVLDQRTLAQVAAKRT